MLPGLACTFKPLTCVDTFRVVPSIQPTNPLSPSTSTLIKAVEAGITSSENTTDVAVEGINLLKLYPFLRTNVFDFA